MKPRKQHEKQIGMLYKRANGFDLSVCAYCGEARECLDHAPPISLAVDLDLNKFFQNGGKLFLYPSCNECNSMLGSKKLATYEERLVYLYKKYIAKIEKQKSLWSEDEIEELGYNLQQMAKKRAAMISMLIRKHRGIEKSLSKIDF